MLHGDQVSMWSVAQRDLSSRSKSGIALRFYLGGHVRSILTYCRRTPCARIGFIEDHFRRRVRRRPDTSRGHPFAAAHHVHRGPARFLCAVGEGRLLDKSFVTTRQMAVSPPLCCVP